MSDLWQRLDRMKDLACEALLFVAETAAFVTATLYYIAIGITLFAVVHFPPDRHPGATAMSRHDFGIVHAITLDIGTALLWGLAHVVAEALAARQTAHGDGDRGGASS